MRTNIKKGLDIPIAGKPEQHISDGRRVSTVAALGVHVHGLRPGMAVGVGDRVRLGQALFIDKRNPDVPFTSPGAGVVKAINRGERRSLQSVVIRLEGDETDSFAAYSAKQLAGLGRDAVVENLVQSGLWTSIRTRPYSHIPPPSSAPAAVFVTAIDTNPLAPDPAVVIADAGPAFGHGLEVIAKLTDGNVYVCTAPDSGIVIPDAEPFRLAEFGGPHPAGLAGTHIHFLEPVSEKKTVWCLGYQAVIAVGRLFTSGRRPTERIVAIGGPMVESPRLVRTRVGASTNDLLIGETISGGKRVISGSILSGHRATGPLAWLGRFHNQVTVLAEGSPREFLAWAKPGRTKFSAERAFASALTRGRRFGLTTTQNGSPRAMVSIGSFEKVMPLDILPTPLLKALLVRDSDKARALGCLELDEEDLALCSFVCNGKYEYGPFLRENLDDIEVNG